MGNTPDTNFSLRLPSELNAELQRVAVETDRSRGAVVRQILRRHLGEPTARDGALEIRSDRTGTTA
jgi:predicted transcriptional regulator